MDPRKLFVDERLTGLCAYCGATPETRDHVPSRVLLDEPYPNNLPVVDACRSCNESFSQDEAYIACLIECVLCGTTDVERVKRQKIKKILQEQPYLMARIKEAKEIIDGDIDWYIEIERIKKVILKLARGHLVFELNVFHFEAPHSLEITPIMLMSDEEISDFELVEENKDLFLPEIGSRSFISMFGNLDTNWYNWKDVQKERYRYRVQQGEIEDRVWIVISEYLACKIIWI